MEGILAKRTWIAASAVAAAFAIGPSRADSGAGTPTFSNPLVIDNTFYPFLPGVEKTFEVQQGNVDVVDVERFTSATRTFFWNGNPVDCRIIEEATYEDGEVTDISRKSPSGAVRGRSRAGWRARRDSNPQPPDPKCGLKSVRRALLFGISVLPRLLRLTGRFTRLSSLRVAEGEAGRRLQRFRVGRRAEIRIFRRAHGWPELPRPIHGPPAGQSLANARSVTSAVTGGRRNALNKSITSLSGGASA